MLIQDRLLFGTLEYLGWWIGRNASFFWANLNRLKMLLMKKKDRRTPNFSRIWSDSTAKFRLEKQLKSTIEYRLHIVRFLDCESMVILGTIARKHVQTPLRYPRFFPIGRWGLIHSNHKKKHYLIEIQSPITVTHYRNESSTCLHASEHSMVFLGIRIFVLNT